MLYKEIITVCSEIHRKHSLSLSLCGQNTEFLYFKFAVHKVATRSYKFTETQRQTMYVTSQLVIGFEICIQYMNMKVTRNFDFKHPVVLL